MDKNASRGTALAGLAIGSDNGHFFPMVIGSIPQCLAAKYTSKRRPRRILEVAQSRQIVRYSRFGRARTPLPFCSFGSLIWPPSCVWVDPIWTLKRKASFGSLFLADWK